MRASQARCRGLAPDVCTVWMAGSRSRTPALRASNSPWIQALARAPPPTWMQRWSNSRSSTMRVETISQTRVLPPSMTSPFSVPWQVKGSAPWLTASRKAVIAGVAGYRPFSGAGNQRGAKLGEARRDGRIRPGRHIHVERVVHGSSNDRGAQGGVATAGDRQPGGGLEVLWPELPPHFQPEHEAHQVSSLVGSGDIAGLVLDPEAAGLEVERLSQLVGRSKGCDAEPAAVGLFHRGVQPIHQSWRSSCRRGPGGGRSDSCEAAARISEKGFPEDRLKKGRLSSSADFQDGGVERRAGGRDRCRRPARPVGSGTDEARRAAPDGRSPDRRESTAGFMMRSRVAAETTSLEANVAVELVDHLVPGGDQIEELAPEHRLTARATKSSIEMPCCSTQVK